MTCGYLRDFLKKFETVLMQYSGAGGKLKKTRSKKSRDTVPLSDTVGRAVVIFFQNIGRFVCDVRFVLHRLFPRFRKSPKYVKYIFLCRVKYAHFVFLKTSERKR